MTTPETPRSDAEQLAELFHTTYEQLAPQFGYTTRKASAVPWAEVPHPNQQLMVAVAARVLEHWGQSGDALRDRLRIALGCDEIPDDDGLVADIEEWIRRARAFGTSAEQEADRG